MKKVSVIIPMHNSSKHIEECLDSVINQTYKNIEIIVVDDNSTDNSAEIVERKKDSRIKLIKLERNLGVSKARNTGIDNATGKYICFLDSDDYWILDKLEKQVEFIENNNYTFIYGGYAYLKGTKILSVKVPLKMTYKEALKNTIIFTATVMFNMEHLKKENIYMPDIKRGQDTATWWKVLGKGITAYGINEILAFYRVGGKTSLSSNKYVALKRTWNLYKREDIRYIKKIYCFTCYIINAIVRRIGIWKEK